jgi:4-phytase/acid phosphatase
MEAMGVRVLAALLAAVGTIGAASPPAASDHLLLTVALFRHGVRAPLTDLNCGDNHANAAWPLLRLWKAREWGDLTDHGKQLALQLGHYYGNQYKNAFGRSYEVYLWTDVDRRTIDTGEQLGKGFEEVGVEKVTVAFRPIDRSPGAVNKDPLFHPYAAYCGTPDEATLAKIVKNINDNWKSWMAQTPNRENFARLDTVLDCPAGGNCAPLSELSDSASVASSQSRSTSPITWKGRFPYASTATEAFLLEYANGMDKGQVGFGRVFPPNSGGQPMTAMLGLHEFYFEQTDRDPYLAKVGGSSLLLEISDQFRRKTGLKVEGCPHATADSVFVGLVGHDTNLAGVGKLLGLDWKFAGAGDATDNLPPNDALPAGALVFELWSGSRGSYVSVFYIAQSLTEMRTGDKADQPYFMTVTGKACKAGQPVCEIPLTTFLDLADRAIDRRLAYECVNGVQTCGPLPAAP